MSKNQVVSVHVSGEPSEGAAALEAELKRELGEQQPKLVMVFASPAHPLGPLLSALFEAYPEAAVVGAGTAGEFTEKIDSKGGVVACAVLGDLVARAAMGTGLSVDVESAVAGSLPDPTATVDGYPHRTAIVLLDTLTGKGEEAALVASLLLGSGISMAGGAAGDDLAMKQGAVGCGSQVACDAMVSIVLHTKKPLAIGVCHGHRALSGPLEVTRADGATVHEVAGKPAWSVWKEHTAEHARARGLDPDQLPEEEVIGYLLKYEAALSAGDELKIRAPLSRNPDGGLNFACGIPQGAVIRITESDAAAQITAAREAARRAVAQLDGAPVGGAIVFDCICRNLILGDEFQGAVRGIAEELGGARLAGFETYGEIALNVGDLSGFHNTTTVVLAFPE